MAEALTHPDPADQKRLTAATEMIKRLGES
jgi:hypothetical protein